MIAGLLSLFGSSAVGSIIGGIFAFLNRKADIDSKKLEFEHQLHLRRFDMEQAQAEASGRLQVAVVEADGMVESARMQAIGASHAADKIEAAEIKAAGKLGWLLVLASALRSFIRPGITLLLVGASLYLNWLLIGKLADASWPNLSPLQQHETAMQAFAWITGQASAVLGYWFVSRGVGK